MNQATEPAEVHAGLAVYRRGDGPPLLLFPYPHASGGGPMIDGALDLRLESFVAAGAARARSTHDSWPERAGNVNGSAGRRIRHDVHGRHPATGQAGSLHQSRPSVSNATRHADQQSPGHPGQVASAHRHNPWPGRPECLPLRAGAPKYWRKSGGRSCHKSGQENGCLAQGLPDWAGRRSGLPRPLARHFIWAQAGWPGLGRRRFAQWRPRCRRRRPG